MAEFPCHATTIVNYVPRKKNFKEEKKKGETVGCCEHLEFLEKFRILDAV